MIGKTLAVVGVMLAAGGALRENKPTIFTRPSLPRGEGLDRANLKVAGPTHATTDGVRDAIKSVALAGDDLSVHARTGVVSCIAATRGQTRWRTTTGNGYPPVSGLAYNSRNVFTINGTLLTAFDRINGRKLRDWDIPGPSVSTPP